MSRKVTLKNWIVPSFDSFRVPTVDDKQQSKKLLGSCKKTNNTYLPATQGQLWVDKHRPKTQEELAVNKKKVEDLRRWLLANLGFQHKRCPMLLITGPAGAGKTATLYCLSNELDFRIQEWTNKTGISFIHGDTVCSESQISTFHNFIKMATKYSSNQIFGGAGVDKKIILIEEFPTAVLRDVMEFHNILRHYRNVGGFPIVFIITDSVKDNKIERHLFPKDIQHDMNIFNISFNPISPTNLNRAILRIAYEEGLNLPKEVLDSLASNSHGDIRAAVNGLQFAYSQDAKAENVKPAFKPNAKLKRSKRQVNEKSRDICSSSSLFGARDESLFLFHALGKVLHCKRDWNSQIRHRLHSSLQDMERHSLVVDPEEMWQKTAVSANNFNSFLQENYVDFFNEIETVGKASHYLSEADCFNTEWTGTAVLEPYILSVSTRGLMYCSKEKHSVGWKPLHKPAAFAVDKKVKENIDLGRSLFHVKHFQLTNEDLFSQLIPYMTKVGLHTLSSEQNTFINDVGRIKWKKTPAVRNQAEFLTEKETVEETASDKILNNVGSFSEVIENSTYSEVHLISEADEEVVIEEFDF